MIPVSLSYSRTKNLGDFNSEKVELTYELGENEDVYEAVKLVKDTVCKALGITNDKHLEPYSDKPAATATAVEKKTPATATKKKETPAAVTAATEPKQEETKTEEAQAQATETKEVAPTATAKRNIAKVKNTVYNRNNEEHKRLLSAFLDKAFPTWKSKDSIKKASEISSKLSEKEDFLDGEGVILESYKQKFLDGLK